MASGQYQNVNGVKTLNLHGKNYVEVAERVHMVHEKKAVFSIVKSEPVNIADRWLWVAVIMVDGQQYIGNAEIKMNAPKNTPDGTNPFECGETSAIGRALAFAGFGSVESIASKDEIERSMPHAETSQPVQSARSTYAKPAKTDEQPKPTSVTPVAKLKSFAESYYPGAWEAVRAALIKKFKIMCELSDEQIESEYNQEARKLIAPYLPAKQPATASSGK